MHSYQPQIKIILIKTFQLFSKISTHAPNAHNQSQDTECQIVIGRDSLNAMLRSCTNKCSIDIPARQVNLNQRNDTFLIRLECDKK